MTGPGWVGVLFTTGIGALPRPGPIPPLKLFTLCLDRGGPAQVQDNLCGRLVGDRDGVVDLRDFQEFQNGVHVAGVEE